MQHHPPQRGAHVRKLRRQRQSAILPPGLQRGEPFLHRFLLHVEWRRAGIIHDLRRRRGRDLPGSGGGRLGHPFLPGGILRLRVRRLLDGRRGRRFRKHRFHKHPVDPQPGGDQQDQDSDGGEFFFVHTEKKGESERMGLFTGIRGAMQPPGTGKDRLEIGVHLRLRRLQQRAAPHQNVIHSGVHVDAGSSETTPACAAWHGCAPPIRPPCGWPPPRPFRPRPPPPEPITPKNAPRSCFPDHRPLETTRPA